MRIGVLAPISGMKEYRGIYATIVAYLQKKGYEVIHPLSFNHSMVHTWSTKERNDFFIDYYAKLNKCDIVIAECSYPCISIGYEIANIIRQGKEVIILKVKDTDPLSKNFDSLYMKKNIYIYEYQAYDLKDILKETLSLNLSQKHKKYNILFTPEMVAKLEEIAKKKNLFRK